VKRHPLWILGALLLLLSPFGLGVGAFVEQGYAAKAQTVQRVKVDKAAGDLFGDAAAHTPVGSPQELIIEDPKAFVEGEGEGGAKLVDEDYLQSNNIYPLQLKTVRYVAELSRFAIVGMAALGAFLIWLGGRLHRRRMSVA